MYLVIRLDLNAQWIDISKDQMNGAPRDYNPCL